MSAVEAREERKTTHNCHHLMHVQLHCISNYCSNKASTYLRCSC